MKLASRVAHPPARPLMIWDGACHFCRSWVERWHRKIGHVVDFETSQSVGARFPEIAPTEYESAVLLVTRDGEVYRAAEAVARALSFAPGGTWALSLYRGVPGAAWVAECMYDLIARHRQFASASTRLLWGKDVRPPTYQITRRVFLRALGCIYLIAFFSLFVQLDGLIGSRGILPAHEFFTAAHAEYGTRAYLAFPSLCWINSSDLMLRGLCGAGALAAMLVMSGILPLAGLFACFVSYLSLTIAGQSFLSFQWDILLLETGLLSLLFAPARWRMNPGSDPPVSSVALFLLKLLLFKLMWMSGVVKLTSGDDCWWNLTALKYHYWTQPLPTALAWYADKQPAWEKQTSVAFCLAVEIIVPFFLWAPRRLRYTAAFLLITLQVAIALTGNYSFFNLLTIALCLLLLDDCVWRRCADTVAKVVGRGHAQTNPHDDLQIPEGAISRRKPNFAAMVAMLVILPLDLWLCYTAARPNAPWPRPLAAVYQWVEPIRIVNGYGLFRVMTKERPEIEIEGSADGVDWQPYAFKWKPGAVEHAPRWNAPHQPRLDWQMWFAALGGPRDEPWFANLLVRLLQNEPAVTGLLERNPFPEKPPQYLRANLFQYQFSTTAERRATGVWWKRREVGEFFPTVALPK